MRIKSLHLTMQRRATRKEIKKYEYYVKRFDQMDARTRIAKKFRRPTDLAWLAGSPVQHIVYYGTREHPMFNEIFIEPVNIHTGVPGASEQVRRMVSSMIAKYRKPTHENFYVTGDFYTEAGDNIGFKTLTARAEFPVRSL